jgi:hypothetical protein
MGILKNRDRRTASTSLLPSSSSHNIHTRRSDPSITDCLTGMPRPLPTPPPSLPVSKIESGYRGSGPPSLYSHAAVTLPPSISYPQAESSFRHNGPSVTLGTASGHSGKIQSKAQLQNALRLSALRDIGGESATDGTIELVRPSRTGALTARRARKTAETSRLVSTEEGKSTFPKQLQLPSDQPGSTISYNLEQEKIEARRNPSHGLTSLSADVAHCVNPIDVEFRKLGYLRADQPVGVINITTSGPYFETFYGPSRRPDPEFDYSRQGRALRKVYRSTRGGRGIEKVDSNMLKRRERSRTRSRSGDGTYCGSVKGIGESW